MTSHVKDHNSGFSLTNHDANLAHQSTSHIDTGVNTDIDVVNDVNNDVDPSVTQAILEKYDRESITRHITHGPVKYFIAILCILYSIFHLYITFNPMPALLQRSVHVGVGFALIFLIFPASKTSSRKKVA